MNRHLGSVKRLFSRAISLGIDSSLSEERKLALRVASVDGYWTLLALSFYFVHTLIQKQYFLSLLHGVTASFVVLGLYLMSQKRFDLGRVLMYTVGSSIIFLNTDAAGVESGYEFFYFTNIALPFVTFSYDEQWKGNVLCGLTCSMLFFQLTVGTGVIMDPIETLPEERLYAVLFVTLYVLTVLTFGRIQIRSSMRMISQQQDDLIHSSKLMALGEMAGGIAHEINNPIQALSLNLRVMKEKFPREDFREHYQTIDDLVHKIGRMVQGLKDLSRNDAKDSKEDFLFSKVLEDVLTVSSDRLGEERINLHVSGGPHEVITGKMVQVSQVLINLLNNSIDALSEIEERWIRIDVQRKSSFLQVVVEDSGRGIPAEHVDKILTPFFTTKQAKKGTGLGLSISNSIVEKNGGRLYYDSTHPNTRFVVLLPLSQTILDKKSEIL